MKYISIKDLYRHHLEFIFLYHPIENFDAMSNVNEKSILLIFNVGQTAKRQIALALCEYGRHSYDSEPYLRVGNKAAINHM